MESILLVLPSGKGKVEAKAKAKAEDSKTAKAIGEPKSTDKVSGIRIPLPVGFAAPTSAKPRAEFDFVASGIIDGEELVVTKLEGLPVPNAEVESPDEHEKEKMEFVDSVEKGFEL
jgi:hypothetical protein